MFSSTIVCQPWNVMTSGLGRSVNGRARFSKTPTCIAVAAVHDGVRLARNVDSVAIRAGPDADRIRGPGRRWRSWRESPKTKSIRIGISARSASPGRAFKPGRAPALLSDSRERLADVRHFAMRRAQWSCCIHVAGRHEVGTRERAARALSPMNVTRACHVRIW
jgi:hypothetical protein